MLDPFPPAPEWLRTAVKPYALALNVPSLPDHFHEVVLAFAFYQSIHSFISPWLSPKLFPKHYPNFDRRTKMNWDVHVVSFVQSSIINTAALWLIFTDQERGSMNAGERVYGYTGASGLVQALATGYFTYDLIISTVHVRVFGIGMVLHGMSALWVFSLGFVSVSSLPVFDIFGRDGLTCRPPETIRQLLHPHLHSLRTVQPVLEYPLVFGQGPNDW